MFGILKGGAYSRKVLNKYMKKNGNNIKNRNI